MSLLIWFYIVNAVLLIVHEIDSAYWHEWKLFKLPGGISFFLVLHLPLVFLILWGLVQLQQNTPAGYVISLILAAAGIFAFTIHMVFMAKGNREFKTPLSIALLIATLVVSIIQAWLTVTAMQA
jgi:hypothetical protein